MGYNMTSPALQNVQSAIIDLMPNLRRFACSLTESADAGNELVQVAFERVLSRPELLAGVERPASWMCCIIRNLWIDEKRSFRNRLSAPLEEGEGVAAEDTERALIARSTLARVREVMASLPAEQRSAIMLVCVNGLSYQEAAAELDIPIGTLMSRLCRGRLELARRMSAPA
jgi:RNA polymerase sigma-70 factor (ECF subfamily)